MTNPPGPPGRSGEPSLLERFPALGKGLAVVLGLMAVGALALAVASAMGGDDEPDGAVDPGGGTLRLGVVGLGSLDPIDARESASIIVADQVFDTLVSYDPKTSAPKGQLAASWEANPEQTVFTFKLRDGAIFHDETPITAADVKFTLERVAAKGSSSPLVAQLEAVTGFGPYHRDGTATELVGVEAPDPATVVVRLDRPFAPFPATLGHPGFGIVPKAAVTTAGDAFKATPVGSGPFRVGAEVEGRVRLTRFGGRRPVAKVDRIDLKRFETAEAAYEAFAKGELEVAPVPPAKVAEAAEQFGTRGMRPVGLLFYGLNVKSPDFADIRFREAVGHAVNRERILTDVYQGEIDAAGSLAVEGLPGYAATSCGPRCEYDPDRAKALIAEAFPNGGVPEVQIDYDDDPAQAEVAEHIKADLEAVGVTAATRSRPFNEYGSFIVSGQQEMFRYGWVGAYPSLDAYLAPLFVTGSSENLSGLSDPDVDAGLGAARAEADPKTRAEIYKKVEQEVLSQFAIVLIAELESRLAVSERVESFVLNPLGTFDGAAVTLAPLE